MCGVEVGYKTGSVVSGVITNDWTGHDDVRLTEHYRQKHLIRAYTQHRWQLYVESSLRKSGLEPEWQYPQPALHVDFSCDSSDTCARPLSSSLCACNIIRMHSAVNHRLRQHHSTTAPPSALATAEDIPVTPHKQATLHCAFSPRESRAIANSSLSHVTTIPISCR